MGRDRTLVPLIGARAAIAGLPEWMRFLRKPFDFDERLAAVHHALGGAREPR